MANVALPISHFLQTSVHVSQSDHPGIADALGAGRALAVVPLSATGGVARVSYTFACRVHEAMLGAGAATDVPPHELEGYRKHSFAGGSVAAAHAVIEGCRGSTNVETARNVFRWLLENVVLLQSPTSEPYAAVLDSGYGSCVQQIMLFVNLCRLAGIPARPQGGAFMTPQIDPNLPISSLTWAVSRTTPFAHLWSEFFDPDHGWVSVELQGDGLRRITVHNVPDSAVRTELRGGLMRAYGDWFGHLTPYRVLSSPQMHRLAPVFSPNASPELAAGLVDRTRHVIRCTFTRVR